MVQSTEQRCFVCEGSAQTRLRDDGSRTEVTCENTDCGSYDLAMADWPWIEAWINERARNRSLLKVWIGFKSGAESSDVVLLDRKWLEARIRHHGRPV